MLLTAPITLLDKLQTGGWTVAIQVAISVVALAIVLERLINLRRARILPSGLAEQAEAMLKQGRIEELWQLCRRRPSTLARMIQAVIEHRHSPADASIVASDIGTREMKLHLQRAYPIAIAAMIEPLLGLFGTVYGMILAFDRVAQLGEMGNAAALSNEISLALVTTAVGLAIAIPLLVAYHFFKNRTAMFALGLEERVSQLISRHVMRRQEREPVREVKHAD